MRETFLKPLNQNKMVTVIILLVIVCNVVFLSKNEDHNI
jgi:hypothetical protein